MFNQKELKELESTVGNDLLDLNRLIEKNRNTFNGLITVNHWNVWPSKVETLNSNISTKQT